MFLLRGTLTGATRIITTQTFSPELQFRLIEQYKVTHVYNAPYQIMLLMNSEIFKHVDFSNIKCLFVGGGKLPTHIKARLSQCFPNGNVIVRYGTSETSGAIAIDHPTSNDSGTVGRLIGGCYVKIIDDNGNRCGVNQDGEICVKMHYKFIGYYNEPKLNQGIFDADGFLYTGDIGHFDASGNLYYIDRKKDILKYGGFQVSPSEIDAYLMESPEIKSACTVGIPDSMGDLLTAVIVRAEGSNISENDIMKMIDDHFADLYKLRGGVFFVDTLPTSSSSKVLRRKVKEMAIELFNARKAN